MFTINSFTENSVVVSIWSWCFYFFLWGCFGVCEVVAAFLAHYELLLDGVGVLGGLV